jgi:hypothetical protein
VTTETTATDNPHPDTLEHRRVCFECAQEARKRYKVVRYYLNGYRKRTIYTGLTLAQAQEHCSDPESSFKSCTSSAGKRRTRQQGPWFDGYTEE